MLAMEKYKVGHEISGWLAGGGIGVDLLSLAKSVPPLEFYGYKGGLLLIMGMGMFVAFQIRPLPPRKAAGKPLNGLADSLFVNGIAIFEES
jgi:hypothetical protein